MNCSDYERTWNEQLDARGAASPDIERMLEAHAASCPACRAVAQRYRTLRQAIRALGPAPAAPIGFADRFLDRRATRARQASRWSRHARPAIWSAALAVAASLAFVLVAGGGRGWSPFGAPDPMPKPPGEARALAHALADATSASWDLARATSAPAARIGREMLGSAPRLDTAPGPTLSLPLDVERASDVLLRVGDRVSAGTRPISRTARHAFGFLLGPAPDDANVPPPPADGA